MTHFADEAAAAAAGYTLSFDEHSSRYTVSFSAPNPAGHEEASVQGEASEPAGTPKLVGSVTFLSDRERGVTTFLSSHVHPDHRGTGLAAILVDHALADRAGTGDRIESRCWYVSRRMRARPDLLPRVP